ncbi:MAG: efflux RND transporter periplasmic adaptor subunit [Acetobacteraceae bacterium]
MCEAGASPGKREGAAARRWRVVFVCAVLAGAAFAGNATAAETQSAAVPVGTVVATRTNVTPAEQFVGRIEAVSRVEIRARVTGYLDAVQFKEGQLVKEGDPLFLIERAPFEATLQQAQGALIKAQGQYANAEVRLQRAEELLKTHAVAVSERDQRKAEVETAKGNVVTAMANLSATRIDLSYTEIRAPITGRIGRSSVTKGNVVGPDHGVLALIVSQDPIYVVFPVSERQLLELRRQGQVKAASRTVRVIFADGSSYDQTGTIDFVDVTVNRETDTVTVRAVLPNPRNVLVDGALVRVSVETAKPEEKVLIPQAALIADQQGTYVFIAKDGKAEVRRVKIGGEKGADAVIDEGLSGGEQVVVQGLQSLRPGSPVSAAPVQPAVQG